MARGETVFPETARHRGPLWSRRATLAAFAGALATSLPRFGWEWPAFPDDALHEVCLFATTSPVAARLGGICAAAADRTTIEAELRARVAGATTREEWLAALVARGRRDIADRDFVRVEGRSLMRTEAQVLALGAILRTEAPTATA